MQWFHELVRRIESFSILRFFGLMKISKHQRMMLDLSDLFVAESSERAARAVEFGKHEALKEISKHIESVKK